MIVLNGEPFVRYNLRALYPFAHEIIVVEGAVSGAASVAGPDGHSTDGTLQTLRDFKRTEDPDDKLLIVTAEDDGYEDGFWHGDKDEKSQAFARRATGDYLWEIAVDEFYLPSAVAGLLDYLAEEDMRVTGASFTMRTFWARPCYVTDGWYLWRYGPNYPRVFRWGPGYRYVTHRPPTVWDESGRDLRTKMWLDGKTTRKMGHVMYHYSLLFPNQVREKSEYYSKGAPFHHLFAGAADWSTECYRNLKRPYRVHNVYHFPSWLERFDGEHPPEVVRMMDDIAKGAIEAELREDEDIERLLRSWWYPLGRVGLQAAEPLDRGRLWAYQRARREAGKVRRRARRLGRRLLPGAVILLYHRIAGDEIDPRCLNVKLQHFEQHLEVLAELCVPRSLDDLATRMSNHGKLRGSVSITFDDGYADSLRTAKPLLSAHDMPATVFVTGRVFCEMWWDELERLLVRPGRLPSVLRVRLGKRRMSWDMGRWAVLEADEARSMASWHIRQSPPPTPRHEAYCALFDSLCAMAAAGRDQVLRELRDQAEPAHSGPELRRTLLAEEVAELAAGGLVEVGAHTVNHGRLSLLSPAEQRKEIADAKARLEEIVGARIVSFAYPSGAHGDYTEETTAIVRDCGFGRACTTVPGRVRPRSDPYQLPRHAVGDWDGDLFAQRLRGWLSGSQ